MMRGKIRHDAHVKLHELYSPDNRHEMQFYLQVHGCVYTFESPDLIISMFDCIKPITVLYRVRLHPS